MGVKKVRFKIFSRDLNALLLMASRDVAMFIAYGRPHDQGLIDQDWYLICEFLQEVRRPPLVFDVNHQMRLQLRPTQAIALVSYLQAPGVEKPFFQHIVATLADALKPRFVYPDHYVFSEALPPGYVY